MIKMNFLNNVRKIIPYIKMILNRTKDFFTNPPKNLLLEMEFNNKKLTGFTYRELIDSWVSSSSQSGYIIILTNINVEAKNIQFWARVPQIEMPYFLKDIIILKCKDESELNRLIENIPLNFADANGYYKGVLHSSNSEDVQ